jgi:hypothetical protein
MIRVNITITPKHQAMLKAASDKTGLAMSDLIRRLIDQHLAELVKRSK